MPDWVAYVDGEKQPVVRANFTFRAVYLQAGMHEIHMVYQPRPWGVGLSLTLTTLAILAAWGLFALIRRWQKQRALLDSKTEP
jgi:uncharacterized membrane protein YfhO